MQRIWGTNIKQWFFEIILPTLFELLFWTMGIGTNLCTCITACPANCSLGKCNQTTGNCTTTCEIGYWGSDCNESMY